ncbi:MAG: ABC transporter substrate-binding protein, partial [Treponema sp.]|nr:ABC transporter substrate-binding protein [Treponema sp.]
MLVLFLAAFSCCAKEQARTAPRREADALRVITTAPALTEIVADLGAADLLVACDRYSAQAAGVPEGLPLVDFFSPDVEALLTLDADLVFAAEINRVEDGANPFSLLEGAGARVIFLPTCANLDGIYADILTIAAALRRPEQGEALVRTMRDEIAALTGGGGGG